MNKLMTIGAAISLVAFIGVLAMRLARPKHGGGMAMASAGNDVEAPKNNLPAPVPAKANAGTETNLGKTDHLPNTGLILPTPADVWNRVPPHGIELELPTNADRNAMLEFVAQHGGKALGQIVTMRQLREIVQREDAIRKNAESLWEGMAIPQLIEQMGEPHGITTGDDPREINPTTSARPWKLKPGEIPFRNAFVLSWDRQSPTPFSSLKLAGHPIEFLYSSHPFATQHQPGGSHPYKVLYLTIDERGKLTKTEWIECCAGMD